MLKKTCMQVFEVIISFSTLDIVSHTKPRPRSKPGHGVMRPTNTRPHETRLSPRLDRSGLKHHPDEGISVHGMLCIQWIRMCLNDFQPSGAVSTVSIFKFQSLSFYHSPFVLWMVTVLLSALIFLQLIREALSLGRTNTEGLSNSLGSWKHTFIHGARLITSTILQERDRVNTV